MSQLIAFYDQEPLQLKGQVELHQAPLSSAREMRSSEGAVRSTLVYVQRLSEAGPFLIPFGEYDDWSLRDRYNEAIRIMNTLGAATITCDSFREKRSRRGIRARVLSRGGSVQQQRVMNSGFDFQHTGAGGAPRDPRPLRWPDEPGFAAAVSSVLENGATEVEINIKSSRTHAVDGEFGLQLKRVGFDLGGGVEHSDATSLHIRATFPQPKKLWR